MKISEKKAKENNRDYAFRIIKENIINLELKPGEYPAQSGEYILRFQRAPLLKVQDCVL